MLKGIVSSVMGTRFDREMKKLRPIVDEILGHEEALASVTEDDLKSRTGKFRELIHERTHAIESEIDELREQRRHTEEPAEREAVGKMLVAGFNSAVTLFC